MHLLGKHLNRHTKINIDICISNRDICISNRDIIISNRDIYIYSEIQMSLFSLSSHAEGILIISG